MSELIEILLLGILVCVVAATVRSINRRRADRRSVELTESGSGGFPCRLCWEYGTGKKSFAYVRVAVSADGEWTFSRRGVV